MALQALGSHVSKDNYMKRLLLTGAAGSIGSVLRKKLAPLAEILRVSDINDLGDAAPNEEIVYCDLSKEDDVYKLVKGCTALFILAAFQ